MSGRNPPSYCTLTLIAMQGHQQKGRQNNTSSNNKDKSNTIIETSTAEDHDDENLHNPETVQDAVIHLEVDEEQWASHKEVRGKPGGYGPHARCQVYGFQILLMLNTNTTIHAFRPETKDFLLNFYTRYFSIEVLTIDYQVLTIDYWLLTIGY